MAWAGLPPCVAQRQHFREMHTTCPFALLRGDHLVRTISGVRMLGCAIRFRCRPLEAGMMNPRRLSIVPAPLLRSVILATGVVGLLAPFGPAGIQDTGPVPPKDISAPSLSTEQELAGAPQPSSMLNDDLGQTDIAMAELSLAGAVADASIALNKPEPVVETASTNSPDVPPTEPAPVQVAMANPSELEPGDAGKAVSSIKDVSSIEIVDECLVVDICVDRYLWALYQRAPKEATIKE